LLQNVLNVCSIFAAIPRVCTSLSDAIYRRPGNTFS
jgi:hypothetical protein